MGPVSLGVHGEGASLLWGWQQDRDSGRSLWEARKKIWSRILKIWGSSTSPLIHVAPLCFFSLFQQLFFPFLECCSNLGHFSSLSRGSLALFHGIDDHTGIKRCDFISSTPLFQWDSYKISLPRCPASISNSTSTKLYWVSVTSVYWLW